ncbi:MAG: hypothetical protein GEU93_02900 [Propionibacteriales bacterium]|nr:hypothetical protein [Propionibacteriales bacterium]
MSDHTAPTAPSSWRRVAGAVVLLTAIISLLLTAFAWPATRSEPRDLPIAVAGPEPMAQQVAAALAEERPGAFEVDVVADRDSAEQAILDRDAYAAFVLSPDGPPEVLTASAASPAVAQVVNQIAQRLAAEQAPEATAPVPVTDVVPLPDDDPRGAGLTAGALPLVLGGILAAALLTQMLQGAVRRLVGALSFAVLGAVAMSAILQLWLGSLEGDYWANVGVTALSIAATSTTILGLEWSFGNPGLGLGAAVMMLLGNPLSGMASAPEMLPSGWGELGQLLPPGAAGTLLRSTAFFDGAGAAGPVTVLASWVAIGFALCLLGSLRSRVRRTQPASAGAATA